MGKVDVAVERDVFAIMVAAHVLVADTQLQWFFTLELVRQRVAIDHELRVLAGRVGQALVEFRGARPALARS